MRLTIGLTAFFTPFVLVCLAATQTAPAQALTSAVAQVSALLS